MRENLSTEHAPEQDEMALVKAVLAGDARALENFQRLLLTPCYRFVFYRLGGNADEVEEVVQDTFVSALESLHRFRGDSSLFTWTCSIAKFKIAALIRNRSREKLSRVLLGSDEQIEAMLAKIEQQELPEEILMRAETEDLVGATMASLPPNYQALLTQKYVEQSAVQAIANRQGVSAKSVESTLTRARVAFRRTFGLLANKISGGHANV